MEFAGNAAAEMTKYGVALSLDDHEVAAAE
jgi:hypothetical protein